MSPCWISPTSSSTTSSSPSPSSRPLQMTQPARRRFPTAAACGTYVSTCRVYSASYDLDRGLCGTDWFAEGTTVSHTFLVAQLRNGVPRCFATSAISTDGLESEWSPLWQDTPRPDGRNRLVWADVAKQ